MEVTRLEVAVSGTGIAKTAAELAALDAQSRMAGDSSTSMGRAVSGAGAALDALSRQSGGTTRSLTTLGSQYGAFSNRVRMTSAAVDDLTARLMRQHAAIKPIEIPIKIGGDALIVGRGSGALSSGIAAEVDKAINRVEADVASKVAHDAGKAGHGAAALDKSISGRLSRIGAFGHEHLTGVNPFTGHLSLVAQGFQALGIGAGGARLAAVSLPILISTATALVDVAAGFTAIGLAAAPAVQSIAAGAMAVNQANTALQNAMPGTTAYQTAAANIAAAWAAIPATLQPAVSALTNMAHNSPMLGQVSRWVSMIAINFANWFSNRGQSKGLMDLLLAMEGVINRIFNKLESPGGGGLNRWFEHLAHFVPIYAHLLDEALKNILSIFHAISRASGEGAGLRVLVALLGTVAKLLNTSIFQGAISGFVLFDKIVNDTLATIINFFNRLLGFFHLNSATKLIGGLTGALLGLSMAANVLRTALGLLGKLPFLGGINKWKFMTGGVNAATKVVTAEAVQQIVATEIGNAVSGVHVGSLPGTVAKDASKSGLLSRLGGWLGGLFGGGAGAAGAEGAGLSLGSIALPALAAGALGYGIYRWATAKPRVYAHGNQYQQFLQTAAGRAATQEAWVPRSYGRYGIPSGPRVFERGIVSDAFKKWMDARTQATNKASHAFRTYQQVLNGAASDTNKMSMASRNFLLSMERTAQVIAQYEGTLQRVKAPAMTWSQVNTNLLKNNLEANQIAASASELVRKHVIGRSELLMLENQAPNLLIAMAKDIAAGKPLPAAWNTFRIQMDQQILRTANGAQQNAALIPSNIIKGLKSKDPLMRAAAIQYARETEALYHINWRKILYENESGYQKLGKQAAQNITRLHAIENGGLNRQFQDTKDYWQHLDGLTKSNWTQIAADVKKGSTTTLNNMVNTLGKSPNQSLKIWEQVAKDVNTGLIPANSNMKSMINKIVGAARSGLLPLPGAGKAAIDKFNTYLRAIGAKGAIGTFKGDWAAFIAWLRAHPATPLIKQPVLPVIPGVSPMFVNQAYRTRQHSQFGGTVFAHMPTWVGEAGREIFVPGQTGTIIPHDKAMAMTSGGETNYNMNFSAMNVRTSDVLNAVRILEMRGGNGRTV